MLVDSAIVVLENIDRHRKMGKSISEAAYVGASEVWGALIASAFNYYGSIFTNYLFTR